MWMLDHFLLFALNFNCDIIIVQKRFSVHGKFLSSLELVFSIYIPDLEVLLQLVNNVNIAWHILRSYLSEQ